MQHSKMACTTQFWLVCTDPIHNLNNQKKTTKFVSNVLEAISELELKKSKNHFSILVLYLPAYIYTGIWNYIRNNL